MATQYTFIHVTDIYYVCSTLGNILGLEVQQ